MSEEVNKFCDVLVIKICKHGTYLILRINCSKLLYNSLNEKKIILFSEY